VSRRNTPEIVISRDELRKLPEYSCTIPTGTTIGKRWRRDVLEPKRFHGVLPRDTPAEWMIGEYYDIGSDKEVGIKWAWAMEAPGKVWRGDLKS
jgi:hypothetical protein